VRFFENIGLQKDARAYARLLAENEVDFDGLTLLQDAHLLELGITKLGIRNKILFGIAGLLFADCLCVPVCSSMLEDFSICSLACTLMLPRGLSAHPTALLRCKPRSSRAKQD
jgi:hypothetical protein